MEYAAEFVKIVDGLASFYAIVKLRQIEKRYLFRATISELVANIQNALSLLSQSLLEPAAHRQQINESLNYLIIDIKNIKRKSRGDTARACENLPIVIQTTRPQRYFWQREAPMVVRKTVLLDAYGKGGGLVRALENDMQDHKWSGK